MNAWKVIDCQLVLRSVPPPIGKEGEGIISVAFAGVCGSDLAKLRRPVEYNLPRPWRPGHEIVGLDPAGRPVAVDPLIPCGKCQPCLAGCTHLCPSLIRLGWNIPGGLAEYVSVPLANLYPLGPGLDPLHAVLADPAAVAVHGIRCSQLPPLGRLAVIGPGTVGQLTAAYAARSGWEVTLVVRSPQALASPVHVLPVSYVTVTEAGPSGTFDAVIDAASGGDPEPLELALRLVRDGGTVVVQNAYDPGVRLRSPLRSIFRRSIRIEGSFSYCRRRSPHDFVEGMSLLRSMPELCRALIGESWPADRLPVALAAGPDARARKIVLHLR